MFSIFKSHTQISKDLHQFLRDVGVKDVNTCFEWAFGISYGSMLICKSDEKWNERHSDLFVLYGHDNVKESTKRIGRAYVQMLANKKEK